MYYFLFILFISTTTTLSAMEDVNEKPAPSIIIVGLDDLLFEPDPVGASNFGWLGHFIENWSVETGQKKLIDIIEKAQENNDDIYMKFHSQIKEKASFRGNELPFLWCLYLAGLITSEEIIKIVKNSIDKNTFFYEKPLKSLLNYITETAFTPKSEASIMIEKQDVIQIMKKLAANEKLQLIILANKREETIKELQNNFPDTFALFKKIYASETIKNIKPNKEVYKYVLADLKIDSNQCYLIDTEINYVNSAKKLGFKTVLFKGCSEELEHKLQDILLIEK